MAKTNSLIINPNRTFTFENTELNEISGRINAHLSISHETSRINLIEICKLLAHVDANKLAEKDGFKTTADYAMDTFGWQKSNVYNYIKVGHAIAANTLPEGNYTVNQYVELLGLPAEARKEAIENGEISEEMTTKELREKVAELKPKKEVTRKEPTYFWYQNGRKEISSTYAIKISEFVSTLGEEFAKTKLGEAELYIWKNEFGYLVFERGDKVTEDTLAEYQKAKAVYEHGLNELDEATTPEQE